MIKTKTKTKELNDRIASFVNIGELISKYLSELDNEWTKKLKLKISEATDKNPWFTKKNIDFALRYWSKQLTKEKLELWTSKYDFSNKKPETIAVVMAGNFPLAGFHDLLCVLITGNRLLIKFSNKDDILIRFLIEYLLYTNPTFNKKITIKESIIKDFNRVIATGSNNTSKYFEYYFKNKPSIIRKNRFSIAILSGKESKANLEKLGDDIFTFFGLGCRNVSKLFVPKNYSFDLFFKSIYKWKNIINNHKYISNYNYNKAINLIDRQTILENGFIILKESESNHSPISVLLYEYYDNIDDLKRKIEALQDNLQCIVSENLYKNEIGFGQTQSPELYDYADNVDTINFLLTK